MRMTGTRLLSDWWWMLLLLQGRSSSVSACSLAPCPNGQTHAPSAPVDTTQLLTFGTNQSCTEMDFLLGCQGCASCDSKYIHQWSNSDNFQCTTTLSNETVSCSELVFDSLNNGHCGREPEFHLCGFVNFLPVTVCSKDDPNNGVPVGSETLTIRTVATECVPNNSSGSRISAILAALAGLLLVAVLS